MIVTMMTSWEMTVINQWPRSNLRSTKDSMNRTGIATSLMATAKTLNLIFERIELWRNIL